MILSFFFFNDTATTEIYTLSLHDALPIYFEGCQLIYADPAQLSQLDHRAAQGQRPQSILHVEFLSNAGGRPIRPGFRPIHFTFLRQDCALFETIGSTKKSERHETRGTTQPSKP